MDLRKFMLVGGDFLGSRSERLLLTLYQLVDKEWSNAIVREIAPQIGASARRLVGYAALTATVIANAARMEKITIPWRMHF